MTALGYVELIFLGHFLIKDKAGQKRLGTAPQAFCWAAADLEVKAAEESDPPTEL